MTKIKFEIPLYPVTVNNWKQPVKIKGKLTMILTKEYRQFLAAAQQSMKYENLKSYSQSKWITQIDPKQKYGLLIRFKKNGNSDYSNYTKAIEDCLAHCKITPDDKHALFSPIIVADGAPQNGFIVEVMFDETLKSFYSKIIG